MTEKQQAYRVYLASQHWQRIRSAAIARDGGKCVDCGSNQGLQVHHWQYRDSPYQTQLRDVYTVCRSCHEKTHDIKRNASGRVVSVKQMPSYLKPVFADTNRPEISVQQRQLTKNQKKQNKRFKARKRMAYRNEWTA